MQRDLRGTNTALWLNGKFITRADLITKGRNSMNKFTLLALIILLIPLTTAPISAQVVSGSLSGIVKDNEGAVIQGADVKIQKVGSERILTSTSDETGLFRFPHLSVGDYKLTVTKENYQNYIIDYLPIHLGTKDFLNIQMQPQTEFEDEIIITAKRPLVETSKSTMDTVISGDMLDNIPLLERDFFEILASVNSVQKYISSADSSMGILISGGRSQDNIFQVDGADSNTVFNGQRQQFYSLDVVDEVQVSTAAYTAEYGRGAGGVINVVTKSGTNRLSGRVSYYLRDDYLDQNEKYDWRYQDISFMLGGPLKKDKVFFLFNYDRITRYDTKDDPLAYWLGQERLFESNFSRNAVFGKISFTPNPNHELVITGNYEPSKSEMPSTSSTRPDRDGGYSVQGGYTATGAHHWTISDYAHLDTYINYRNVESSTKRNTPGDPPVTNFWYALTLQGLTLITEGPMYSDSLNEESGFTLNEKLQVFSGDTSWGTHNVAIGGDFGYSSLDAYEELSTVYVNRPGVSPPTLKPYSKTEAIGDPSFSFSQTVASAYIQDEWKVNRNFVLNLGIRLDHNSFLGNSAFSPRLGFALDPASDNRTVIRGGFGIYYSKNFFQFQRMVSAPEIQTSYDFFGFGLFIPSPISGKLMVAPDIKTPHTMEASIGFERMISSDITISASFIYKRNRDQFLLYADNLPDENTGLRKDPSKIYSLMTYGNRGWSDYQALALEFNKRYADRWTFRAGYTWSSAQGNSSDFYDNPVGLMPGITQQDQDSWINAEGPTMFDLTHQLKMTTVVNLPFDILASGFYILRSGRPVTVKKEIIGPDSMPIPINTERLPCYRQLDLRLQKTISLGGHYKLHIYYDMINAFNVRNVISVDTTMNFLGVPNPNYLKPQGPWGYNRERESQIGIKFDF